MLERSAVRFIVMRVVPFLSSSEVLQPPPAAAPAPDGGEGGGGSEGGDGSTGGEEAQTVVVPDFQTQKEELLTLLAQRLKKGDTWCVLQVCVY